MSDNLDSEAIDYFKKYLRIPSISPGCDYENCVTFLKSYAMRLGLMVVVHEVAVKKPVVVISWPGNQVELPSLLLSSHMDVVPVFKDKWTHEPFGAEEDEAGNIYARGAQDMKCVGIQYLEAVHRLILQNYQPKRSVHICFTPDEEVGSQGMKLFVETDMFKRLNVGCMLDEGTASEDEIFNLSYGERTIFPVTIVCSGTPGHGSLLLENTVGEKISFVLQKFMEKRDEEKKKLLRNPNLTVGDITSINLTIIEGGVQFNVIPPEMKLRFDCRLSFDVGCGEFENWIADVCEQAGNGVRPEFKYENKKIKPTKLDDANPWWVALKTVFDENGWKLKPCMNMGVSDSRWLRNLDIPAFGFSPMNFTECKMHEHEEFLNRKIFLNGINIYCKVISSLSNM